MHTIIKLNVILLLFVMISCGQNSRNFDVVQEDVVIDEYEIKRKQLSDSTVSLSFSGIPLGGHIRNVHKANREGKIKIGRKTADSIFCSAQLYAEKYLPIDVTLSSGYFQDTVTGFNIISRDYKTRNVVMSIYKDRYNTDYAERIRDGNCYKWNFKNQALLLDYKTYVEEVIYIKNPNMRMPQNRYGTKHTLYFDKIIISYVDFAQKNKFDAYILKITQEANAKRYREDSILRAKIKQGVINQDI